MLVISYSNALCYTRIGVWKSRCDVTGWVGAVWIVVGSVDFDICVLCLCSSAMGNGVNQAQWYEWRRDLSAKWKICNYAACLVVWTYRCMFSMSRCLATGKNSNISVLHTQTRICWWRMWIACKFVSMRSKGRHYSRMCVVDAWVATQFDRWVKLTSAPRSI